MHWTLLAAVLASLPQELPPEWRDLPGELEALRVEGHVPALALALLADGKPVYVAGFGEANADTPMRWGSITKTVTARALAELVAEHALDPQTPLVAIPGAPDIAHPWHRHHPVRLVHLAELAAGNADLGERAWNLEAPLPLGDALALDADSLVPRWPPGLQHAYSNVTPALSEAVIERVSRSSFRDYVARSVFRPLGMTSAGFDLIPGLPGGFRADGRTTIPYWHMAFVSFGALNASVTDMARLVAALIAECVPLGDAPHSERSGDEQRRVSRSSSAAAQRPELPVACGGAFAPTATLAARNGLRIGYGWGTYGRVRQGFVFHGHGGDADGYRSRFGLLPQGGRGYAVVINTDNPALLARIERHIEATLVRGLVRPTPPPAVDDDLAQYAGTYYPASARFAVGQWRRGASDRATVEVRGGALTFVRGERTHQLVALGSGLFRRPDDPLATVVFARFEGSLYLQGEVGNWVRIDPGPIPGFIAPVVSQ